MAAEALPGPGDEGPLFAVVEGWQQKPEARGLINALLKRNKRRNFGRLLLSQWISNCKVETVRVYFEICRHTTPPISV